MNCCQKERENMRKSFGPENAMKDCFKRVKTNMRTVYVPE